MSCLATVAEAARRRGGARKAVAEASIFLDQAQAKYDRAVEDLDRAERGYEAVLERVQEAKGQ